MDRPEIQCVYCNKPWTEEMHARLEFCEGSYTAGCVGSKYIVRINCPHCKKSVYAKEVTEDPFASAAGKYDDERWESQL